MGWTYRMRHGRKVLDLLQEDLRHSEASPFTAEIVGHSIGLRVAYLAVKHTRKADGVSFTWGCVALLDLTRRKDDPYDFGVKFVDETMGPCETDCPARILDMLTPRAETQRILHPDAPDVSQSDYAQQWRDACRATLAKKAAARGVVKVGATIRLPHPLRFADGKDRDTFMVEAHPFKKAAKVFRSVADGVRCRLTRAQLAQAASV